MRDIQEYQTTTNPTIYRRLRKERLANGVEGKTFIRCTRCKAHRLENASFKKRKGRKQKTTDMDNFKFKVNNAKEFEEAQKYLFSQGVRWIHSGDVLQHWDGVYTRGIFIVDDDVIINALFQEYEKKDLPLKKLTVKYSFEPVFVRETVVIGDKKYYLDELEVALTNIKPIKENY